MRFLLTLLFVGTITTASLAGDKAGQDGTPSGETPPLPSPYEARYKASYKGLPVTNVRTLTRDGESYQLVNEAKNFLGHIREQETFRIDDAHRIDADRYAYERSIFGSKRRETAIFQPDEGQVTTVYKDERETMPLREPLYGPLSYQIAMRRDLMAGREELAYPVVRRGDIKVYRYLILGEEQLDTHMGELETVKLQRDRDTDERETLLWVAPELDYLPVKLRQIEDGDSYEMLIEAYTATGENRD